MKIHHIGYAVKKIEKAKETLENLGYKFNEVVEDKTRNLQIAFGENDGVKIELLSPIAPGSPVDEILNKNGSMPYHICYETDDIEQEIKNLKQHQFRMIIKPEPACAIQGKRVAFLMNLSIGLIELVER